MVFFEEIRLAAVALDMVLAAEWQNLAAQMVDGLAVVAVANSRALAVVDVGVAATHSTGSVHQASIDVLLDVFTVVYERPACRDIVGDDKLDEVIAKFLCCRDITVTERKYLSLGRLHAMQHKLDFKKSLLFFDALGRPAAIDVFRDFAEQGVNFSALFRRDPAAVAEDDLSFVVLAQDGPLNIWDGRFDDDHPIIKHVGYLAPDMLLYHLPPMASATHSSR